MAVDLNLNQLMALGNDQIMSQFIVKPKIKYLESSGDISDKIKKIEDYIDNIIEKSPNDKKLSIYLHNPQFFIHGLKDIS